MFANIQKDLLFDHAIPSLFQNGSVTILESQFIIFVPNDPKTVSYCIRLIKLCTNSF